ncbi:hypothetical protein TCAL_17177 [Tigriopus californicus]|uniref:L-Fucosyltransferase n=1 Tax=Tigriopus californicus TaxID=6832 RepID=A0A553N9D6_TIGCA|nr:hypothetical protein TCAL_17177 [Tigriopus californicus]
MSFYDQGHRKTLIDVFPMIPFEGTKISRSCMKAAKSLNPRLLKKTNAFLATKPMVFVVASDDPQWCKTQFGTMPNKTVIFANEAFKDNLGFDRKYLDMAIMSKCNHSIFDYGTFGFWGAYLAGGHTILAHHIGTGKNPEVENVRQAELPNWHFIEAHGKS